MNIGGKDEKVSLFCGCNKHFPAYAYCINFLPCAFVYPYYEGASMKAKGDELEKHVLKAGAVYEFEGRARIEKTNPAIRIKSRKGRSITGRLDGKGTVDFKGCLRNGRHFAFDAKESAGASFPLKNVAEHQIIDLKATEEYAGIAFLLVYMRRYRAVYCVSLPDIYYTEKTGRKSIPIEYMRKHCYECMPGFGGVVYDFLPYIFRADYDLKMQENQLSLI